MLRWARRIDLAAGECLPVGLEWDSGSLEELAAPCAMRLGPRAGPGQAPGPNTADPLHAQLRTADPAVGDAVVAYSPLYGTPNLNDSAWHDDTWAYNQVRGVDSRRLPRSSGTHALGQAAARPRPARKQNSVLVQAAAGRRARASRVTLRACHAHAAPIRLPIAAGPTPVWPHHCHGAV